MGSKKLFVIIGITGNQGGSGARTFLSDPNLRDHYRLRGISRDPQPQASKSLSDQGVQIVKADLHDPRSLEKALEGANIVFSVTDFWALYFNPEKSRSSQLGIEIVDPSDMVKYIKSEDWSPLG